MLFDLTGGFALVGFAYDVMFQLGVVFRVCCFDCGFVDLCLGLVAVCCGVG